MSAPTVSVIVIFYDDERFLGEAVNSVLAQSYRDWELILADDGSTDGSAAIARRYVDADPARVRYVEHPGHVNLGISATRNRGITASSGRYVAFLDSDDVWEPNKLAEQVAIMHAHPDVGLVVGASRYWYGWDEQATEPDRIRRVGAPQDTVIAPPGMVRRVYPLGKGSAPCPSTFLARRQLLEEVGGFEAHMPGLYDDQGFLAKAYLATSVYVSGRCWCSYRRHPGAITMTTTDAQYDGVRRYYLDWYGAYLVDQQIEDGEVAAALRRAWEPYTHPRRAAMRRRLGIARARRRRTVRRVVRRS